MPTREISLFSVPALMGPQWSKLCQESLEEGLEVISSIRTQEFELLSLSPPRWMPEEFLVPREGPEPVCHPCNLLRLVEHYTDGS